MSLSMSRWSAIHTHLFEACCSAPNERERMGNKVSIWIKYLDLLMFSGAQVSGFLYAMSDKNLAMLFGLGLFVTCRAASLYLRPWKDEL